MNDEANNGSAEFDLRPDPRILPMLGEINLPLWRCVAELIDNSIDGFLTAERNSEPIEDPLIYVNVPTTNVENAKVTVVDNGPGMIPEKLEKAVRAGWTGNDPMNFLGMFGMGFNIATARLGTITTVWTTRKEDTEWHGLEIDFSELQRQRHYRTPHLRRPKNDSADHGTEVTIKNLKPEQRKLFASSRGRGLIKRELAKAYSAMLQPDGVPICFSLELNGTAIRGRRHCVWGEDRTVSTHKHGDVAAVYPINNQMEDRLFCTVCWNWLPAGEEECVACGPDGEVVLRERRVHGWIGIQRYLSDDHYGIDFLRNGRKIELLNRDLFQWNDNGSTETEYPIDDPRYRGRIVGEIHIDHCRVTYMKDRFDRTDPAWEDMVNIIRGEGPLRPAKAGELGYPLNTSPLYKLFQVFRRSSPKPKVAGCYQRLLVIPDNERFQSMAEKFYDGESEYQDDTKWWKLIEEADNQLLREQETATTPTLESEADGFGAESDESALATGEDAATEIAEAEVLAKRKTVASLTRDYHHQPTRQHWDVTAYEVDPADPALGDSDRPWSLEQTTPHVFDFFVNRNHCVFQSATMTPLDGLLAELAWWLTDYMRDTEPVVFSTVLADFRDTYGGSAKLDPVYLSSAAELTLTEIARALPRNEDIVDDFAALFGELPSSDREAILRKMAARDVKKHQTVITGGQFLEYAPFRTIIGFFTEHPGLFLDGRYWDDPYEEIDFDQAAATEEARGHTVRYFRNLLLDAAWLAEQDPTDLGNVPRNRLLRAALALDLLEPEIDIEDQ